KSVKKITSKRHILKINFYILSLLLILPLMAGFTCSSENPESESDSNPSVLNDFNVKGKKSLVFDSYQPLKDKPVKLWYYTPVDNPKDLPILFVMHGTKREGERYMDNLIEFADQYQFIIIAPEFSKAKYPGSAGYNLGNMFDDEGVAISEDKWSFSIIEPIFDFVVSKINGNQKNYDMFGHSAGAQFVHRFLVFKKDTRVNRLVSANAGWYTLPDFQIDFPYGLKGTEAGQSKLERALQKSMTILLGEEDIKRDKYLRITEEADMQGLHRLERGQYYYQKGIEIANTLNTTINWTIQFVPGVGHSSKGVSPATAKILYE
ncbi:MAG: hypothetical protein MJA31_01055, partial [Clostridia bacterium]|nr:hypothetical protein [Clostridia bacterium]